MLAVGQLSGRSCECVGGFVTLTSQILIMRAAMFECTPPHQCGPSAWRSPTECASSHLVEARLLTALTHT
jgi:hypothetical protein